MNFSDQLQEASKFLEARDLKSAEKVYAVAHALAQTDHERMRAVQLLGITYRLSLQYQNAHTAFRLAKVFARNDPADTARINRDWGMVYLDEATHFGRDRDDLTKALELFHSSRNTLDVVGEHIEAAVSDGFIGRAYLVRGQNDDRRLASFLLQASHDKLTGNHDVYELNNLVWLARASLVKRFVYVARARELAEKTDQPVRWKEYLVILIGGDISYRILRRIIGA